MNPAECSYNFLVVHVKKAPSKIDMFLPNDFVIAAKNPPIRKTSIWETKQ